MLGWPISIGLVIGSAGLLLERLCPAVPELRLVVEGVQNGRRVALADAAFDTDRGG